MVNKLICLTALLAGSSAIQVKQSSLQLAGESLEKEQVMSQVIKTWRYFDGDDQGMDLAETKNHARIVLDKSNIFSLAQEKSKKDKKDSLCDGKNKKNEVCLNMKNNHNMAYMATVYLGTPPQKLRAIFDTGSSNTWVVNKEAVTDDMNVKYSYSDTESKTCKQSDQKADIRFGSGSLSGHFYSDTMRIGSPGQSQIVIQNQQFGNVEKQKTIFNGGFEAIIGLAYPKLAEPGITPVFDNMMNQHLLKSNLFAFYLTNKNEGMESDITFGYYDTSKFMGKIVWHPIVFEYMFGIKLDDIKIGGKSLGICGKGGLMGGEECIITVDSGSSEFAMPDLIYDKLPSIGFPTKEVSVGCEDFTKMSLTYVINGVDYVIDPIDWLDGPVSPKDQETLDQDSLAQQKYANQRYTLMGLAQSEAQSSSAFIDNVKNLWQSLTEIVTNENIDPVGTIVQEPKVCYGKLMRMKLEKNMFLVGDVFMRKYYSIYDRQRNRVGLALSA